MIFIGLYLTVGLICFITNNGKNRMPRKIACIVIFIYMQLLIGLRNINYGGVDTQVYARDFMRIVNQNYSFFDIFSGFFKDFGFYLFAKLFSLFSSNMNAWIFVSALPYTIGVTWLIYTYSENIFISFIMFLSYGFYLYNFQLMRHVFALGIIILAFKFLQEEQYKKYFITVIIATFCHTIAIIFLGAYFVQKGKIGAKQLGWVIFGGILVLCISQPAILSILFKVLPFLGGDRFSKFQTKGGSLTGDFIIQLFFICICWYYLNVKGYQNNIRKNNANVKYINYSNGKIILSKKNNKFFPHYINMTGLLNMAILGYVFYLMTIAISESYRMAQYFSLFTILLVPNTLVYIKNKNIRYLLYLIIVLFGIKHFFGGLFVEGGVYNPYVFYWQATQRLY